MAQGFASWSKLAKQMPGRSSKQCRERWSNHLDPCKFSLSLLLFMLLLLLLLLISVTVMAACMHIN
jgi:Myb-like DNA-binding domain